MIEYADDRMLVHVAPTDLLIVIGGSVVSCLSDPNPGNHQKYWLEVLPGFDVEKFPFVVVSGCQSFNLVNVKEKCM